MPLNTDAKLKAEPIKVSEDSPFFTDSAGSRQALAVSLTRLVASVSTPYVLAVSAPWGTGKTTFMEMWANYAASAKAPSEKLVIVKLNAWENDFADDPLIPFLSVLEDTKLLFEGNVAIAEKLRKVKTAGKALAKAALPLAVKVATLGALDAEKEIEKAISDAAGAGIKDALDHHTKEKGVIQKFREALSDLVDAVKKENSGGRLVVFIDELDRCRPDYALKTLERMKHIFSVDGVAFVLFIDREQLGASLRHVYGEGLDDHEYLKRFVDNECTLPRPDYKSVVRAVFSKYGVQQAYGNKTVNGPMQEVEELADFYSDLARNLDVSLRSLEQCAAQLCIALLSLETTTQKYPHFLAFLILAKACTPNHYREYVRGKSDGLEFVELVFSKGIFADPPDVYRSGQVMGMLQYYSIRAMKNKTNAAELIAKFKISMEDDARITHIRELANYDSRWNAPNHQWLLRTMEYVGAFDEQTN